MRAGADWIKILTSHRSDIPEFTQEELDAAVDECHRRRIKCAVHAGTQPAIEMCINAGFDTIEHGTFMTVEQAEKMAEKGLAWTPTITAYTYLYEVTKRNLEEGIDTSDNPIAEKEMRDYHYYEPAARSYRENFKKLADTGVTVLAGSDMVLLGAPVCPIPEELGYMVQYGFNSLQAIQAATSNPAKVLGIQDEVGELKEGLAADILVVDGDTEEDITTLMKINTVYQAGRVVYADNELKVK